MSDAASSNHRLQHPAADEPSRHQPQTTRNTPKSNNLQLSPLLTAKEAAVRLKVSLSWLAKARMRGDGPPYICIGRSIRYAEPALIQWMKSRQRLSTSEH
jgi:predicted DNA-binding transcriptional regulator AlpA